MLELNIKHFYSIKMLEPIPFTPSAKHQHIPLLIRRTQTRQSDKLNILNDNNKIVFVIDMRPYDGSNLLISCAFRCKSTNRLYAHCPQTVAAQPELFLLPCRCTQPTKNKLEIMLHLDPTFINTVHVLNVTTHNQIKHSNSLHFCTCI